MQTNQFCNWFVATICVAAGVSPCFAEAPPIAAPPLAHATVIVQGTSSERISIEQCVAELAKANVAFLGEQHTDETTHRFELAIYEQLLALRKNKVVLSLEMFDRDVQPMLDRYLAGEIAESEFLAQSRPWSNYQEAYRPLIEMAKHVGAPVVAANYPASLRKRVAMEGPQAIEGFTDEERRLTPRTYLPSTPAYWDRVDNAIRSHAGMMPAGGEEDRLYSTQSLWDNSMGEACADALDRHPGHMVLHINGGFHSAYRDGVVHQLQRRKPDVRISTVAILPVANPATQRLVGVPVADYLALVESSATNIDDGKRTVTIATGASYLFHLPASASADHPVPLLIWLTDDGLSAEDGMALCRAQFGEAAAIAVIEPLYKERQPDLTAGGRWFWPESFAADAAVAIDAVDSVWAYLLRHFPIDAQRVCLAGEGTGGTIAVASALHTDRMTVKGVALSPRQYSQLRDMPLPLPEYFLPGALPSRTVAVAGDESMAAWWREESEAYSRAKMPSRFIEVAADPWIANRQRMDLISESLGLAPPPTTDDGPREYLVAPHDTPRARHWAQLQAAWLSQEGGKAVVAVDTAPEGDERRIISIRISSAAAAQSGVLPMCPGPFGGTTVIVLPDETSDDQAEEWLALEGDDPLTRASKFHRLRIAFGRGDRSLTAVLTKLNAEGRRNVLIVPAAFYAAPEWLQSLQRESRSLENQMTIQWLPGLGGRKGILPAAPKIQP